MVDHRRLQQRGAGNWIVFVPFFKLVNIKPRENLCQHQREHDKIRTALPRKTQTKPKLEKTSRLGIMGRATKTFHCSE